MLAFFALGTLITALQAAPRVTLAWDPNPDPELASYLLYYGPASGQYTNAVDVGNETNYTVRGLLPGSTYYFVVRALNIAGVEGEPSNEVSYSVPLVDLPLGVAGVATMPAERTEAVSVVLKGVVNPNGEPCTVWFEYGTDKDFGRTAGVTNLGAGYSLTLISTAINNLVTNTTYYFRLVASNSFGVSRAGELKFRLAVPPAVSTVPANAVGGRSAILHGLVNPNGTETAFYFEYGTEGQYNFTTDSASLGAFFSTIPVGIVIPDLLPACTYQFRAVASNEAGVVRGENLTFQTQRLAPEVKTLPVAGVSDHSAILQGEVNPNGLDSVLYFEYGTNGTYSFATDFAVLSRNYRPLSIGIAIQELAPGVTYQFRVVASNAAGVVPGATLTFTTVRLSPLVSTQPADGVSDRGAFLHSEVNPNGLETSLYFEYGSNTNYGLSTDPAILSSTKCLMSVGIGVQGLAPLTTYHFRAVASNAAGLVQGTDRLLTTRPLAPVPPLAVTVSADGVSDHGATLHGVVNPNGLDTVFYFDYGLDTTYGLSTDIASLSRGTNPMAVGIVIQDLLPGRTYHFRAVASNTAGVALGPNVTFNTLASAPAVATLPIESFTEDGITLEGLVSPNGAETAIWFEYSVGTNYVVSTPIISVDDATDEIPIRHVISGLAPQQEYHFRIMASNSVGLSCGGEASLTLSAAALNILTQPASGVRCTQATLNGAVNPNGRATVAWFEYGLTPTYGLSSSRCPLGRGTEFLPISSPLSGLEPNTTYHFRIVTETEAGLFAGSDLTFQTPESDLAAASLPATKVGQTSAQLNGVVNPNGYRSTLYFEYGLTTNYSFSTSPLSLGEGYAPANVNRDIFGLEPATTYQYRIIVSNRWEIVVGENQSFTTLR